MKGRPETDTYSYHPYIYVCIVFFIEVYVAMLSLFICY